MHDVAITPFIKETTTLPPNWTQHLVHTRSALCIFLRRTRVADRPRYRSSVVHCRCTLRCVCRLLIKLSRAARRAVVADQSGRQRCLLLVYWSSAHERVVAAATRNDTQRTLFQSTLSSARRATPAAAAAAAAAS